MFRSAFVTFAGCVVALYAVGTVVGLMVDGTRFFPAHFALGMCAIFFTLLAHCLVMTYFIVSGKMIRLAVDESRLDRNFIVQSKELKAQTFPFMIAAILLLLATAFFGAAVTNHPEMAPIHFIAALAAAGYNIFTFFIQYGTISRSMTLTDDVLRQHNDVREQRRRGASPPGERSGPSTNSAGVRQSLAGASGLD